MTFAIDLQAQLNPHRKLCLNNRVWPSPDATQQPQGCRWCCLSPPYNKESLPGGKQLPNTFMPDQSPYMFGQARLHPCSCWICCGSFWCAKSMILSCNMRVLSSGSTTQADVVGHPPPLEQLLLPPQGPPAPPPSSWQTQWHPP
jgi:hypothetical protein